MEQKIDTRLNQYDNELQKINQQIDFFVRTSLPPVEGVFFNGQIFDAYEFALRLIKSARRSLVRIDNSVDDSVLLMLRKRAVNVTADLYTAKFTPQLSLDVEKHNSQYAPIHIHVYRNSHDRFIIVDHHDVYHIGASLKDLGKKLFAFSKLEESAEAILRLLEI